MRKTNDLKIRHNPRGTILLPDGVMELAEMEPGDRILAIPAEEAGRKIIKIIKIGEKNGEEESR